VLNISKNKEYTEFQDDAVISGIFLTPVKQGTFIIFNSEIVYGFLNYFIHDNSAI
jgi:hypothetical protein